MGIGRLLYGLMGEGCVVGSSVMVLLNVIYIVMYWYNTCVGRLQLLA